MVPLQRPFFDGSRVADEQRFMPTTNLNEFPSPVRLACSDARDKRLQLLHGAIVGRKSCRVRTAQNLEGRCLELVNQSKAIPPAMIGALRRAGHFGFDRDRNTVVSVTGGCRVLHSVDLCGVRSADQADERLQTFFRCIHSDDSKDDARVQRDAKVRSAAISAPTRFAAVMSSGGIGPRRMIASAVCARATSGANWSDTRSSRWADISARSTAANSGSSA